ncbi:MAG: hypothetical protein RR317_00095 [Bilophila sp.]
MDTVCLKPDGRLFDAAGLLSGNGLGALRMVLELDEACCLRSFFALLRRYPLLLELVPSLSEGMLQLEDCPDAGCAYPGLQRLELEKRIEITGYPGVPRVDVYLALAGQGDALPELRFLRLRDMLDVPLCLGGARHILMADAVPWNCATSFTLFELVESVGWELSFQGGSMACNLKGGVSV